MDNEVLHRVEGDEISITVKTGDESRPSEVIKVENHENGKEGNNSRTKTNILQKHEASDGGKSAIQTDKDDHVIDIKSETEMKHGESSRDEKICRICHLGTENSSGSSELIQLGCGCKAELGLSHRLCAESWFKQRGNRYCEICGKIAKNITGLERVRPAAVDWNGTRVTLITSSYPLPDERSSRCKQSCCNILLACFILAFTVPWFIRIHMF